MINVLDFISTAISNGIRILFEPKQEQGYHASFADAGEIASMWNHGMSICGSKFLSRELSHENLACFSATGGGKTSSIVIPSIIALMRSGSSMVIFDAARELKSALSGYANSKGYLQLYLNPADEKFSECFNPIAYTEAISDIQKLCTIAVHNSMGEAKGEKFWEVSSIALLSLLVRYVRFHCKPELANFENVNRILERLSYDPAAVDMLIARTGNSELISAYKSTLSMGERTLSSVIASLKAALTLWTDPIVCKTTATNTIDIESIRSRPTLIWVCAPLKDLTYYKPILALFFQCIFNHILSHLVEKTARSVFIILEEASTFRFPAFPLTVSNIRKFNSGMLICTQDPQSLRINYSESETYQITTNCQTVVYLKNQPLHTASEISKLAGKTTIIENEKEKVIDLLTIDQIRTSDRAIIFSSNHRPISCRIVPHFRNPWLRHCARMPPFQFPEKPKTPSAIIKF